MNSDSVCHIVVANDGCASYGHNWQLRHQSLYHGNLSYTTLSAQALCPDATSIKTHKYLRGMPLGRIVFWVLSGRMQTSSQRLPSTRLRVAWPRYFRSVLLVHGDAEELAPPGMQFLLRSIRANRTLFNHTHTHAHSCFHPRIRNVRSIMRKCGIIMLWRMVPICKTSVMLVGQLFSCPAAQLHSCKAAQLDSSPGLSCPAIQLTICQLQFA